MWDRLRFKCSRKYRMLNTQEISKIRKILKSDDNSLSDTFAALGDKTRYRIMELLNSKQKLCVSDLAAVLEMTVSCVSQHLRILEMTGLVERERNGRTICYRSKNSVQKIKSVLDLI